MNNSIANIKLPNAQLSKIVQSQGFIRRVPGPLLKTDLPLIEYILKTNAKCH